MTEELKFKLAGELVEGDVIFVEDAPAVVKYAQKYHTAMLPGVQVELLIQGADFTSALVLNAGDRVLID